MACTSRPVDGIVILLLYITYCLGDYPPRDIGPSLPCPYVRGVQGTVEVLWQAGREAFHTSSFHHSCPVLVAYNGLHAEIYVYITFRGIFLI